MIIFQWSLVLVALSQGTNEANEAVSTNQPTAVASEIQRADEDSLNKKRRSWHIAKKGIQNLINQGYIRGKKAGYSRGYRLGYGNGKRAGYSRGYRLGYGRGKSVGYKSGYGNGNKAGYSRGYRLGYSRGHGNGNKAGYSRGYRLGYGRGKNVGYKSGWKSGYIRGKKAGYSRGYRLGFGNGKRAGYRQISRWISRELNAGPTCRYTRRYHTYISTKPHFQCLPSSLGLRRYRSLSTAKRVCSNASDCGGIVKNYQKRDGWRYELRCGKNLYKSPSNEIAWFKRC